MAIFANWLGMDRQTDSQGERALFQAADISTGCAMSGCFLSTQFGKKFVYKLFQSADCWNFYPLNTKLLSLFANEIPFIFEFIFNFRFYNQ